MRDFETSMAVRRYDTLQETRKWMKELPYLHFKQEWNVKIIPPFSGAVIRFCIDYNGKHASVYFDGYSELGYMDDEDGEPIPYFEFYDGDDCYRYLMHESKRMMDDIEKFLNGDD